MKTYLIQSGCGDGAIKVGRAHKPLKRLRTLQCGNPFLLTLVAVVDDDIECLLHELFRDHRIRGEWYHVDAIDGLRKLLGNPLLVGSDKLYSIIEQFDANKKPHHATDRFRYEVVPAFRD